MQLQEENPQLRKTTKKQTKYLEHKRSAAVIPDQPNEPVIPFDPPHGVLRFYEQIETNKRYIEDFENKLDSVYQRETYRNYLNEQYLKKILKRAEMQKQDVLDAIEKEENHSMEGCGSLLREINHLEHLKKGFEEVKEKMVRQLGKEKKIWMEISTKNYRLKGKIKEGWSQLEQNKNSFELPILQLKMKKIGELKGGSVKHCERDRWTKITAFHSKKDSQRSNSSSSSNSLSSSSKPSSGNSQTIHLQHHQKKEFESSQSRTKIPKKYREYLQSCWIRGKSRAEIRSIIEKSINTSLNHHGKLAVMSQHTGILTPNPQALSKYNQAIEKIAKIEENINSFSKVKRRPDIINWKTRIQKIKERIDRQDHYLAIQKLFLVYLKKNEESQNNKTGIHNIRKVRCYLQKVVQDKREVLQQLTSIISTIHS